MEGVFQNYSLDSKFLNKLASEICKPMPIGGLSSAAKPDKSLNHPCDFPEKYFFFFK